MADTKKAEAPGVSEQTTLENVAEAPAPPAAPDIGGGTPTSEMSAEEAAALAGEADKGLHDIGAEQLEPPTPFDIPAPDMADGDVVVPSNVINGLFSEKQAAAREAEAKAAEQDKAAQTSPAAEEQTAPKRRGGRPRKEQAEQEPEAEKTKRGGRPRKEQPEQGPEADKPKRGGRPPKATQEEKAPEVPAEPEPPPPPRDATRPGDTETIVYIAHADLHPFKGHPFQVRDDDAMKSLVESVKERGVDQPALVRPREGGGYELVAGHRRQHASELAGYENVPCIVRNMTDDEAILAMTESNFNQRAEILPSERAQALKMQLDAIKRQGARFNGVATGDVGKRSNEIIAERNKMSIKNVQRYINLNNLVPELMSFVDDKKIKFTVAVDLSFIKPKNQKYIAVAMEAQQSAPSGAQAQRMRELDGKGVLNGDVIDGIMIEEKKEETRVILNSQELGQYFGPDKTPREMKDTILKLLDEYKEKNPLALDKPPKSKEAEK